MKVDLLQEYANAKTEKSWKEFQMERMNEIDRQRVLEIEVSKTMNMCVIDVLNQRIDRITKDLRNCVQKLENDNNELFKEHQQLIYQNCDHCSGPSYNQFCGGDHCW